MAKFFLGPEQLKPADLRRVVFKCIAMEDSDYVLELLSFEISE